MNSFFKHLSQLKKRKTVDQIFLEKYLQRISLQEKLTRAEGALAHFGAFFLPYHEKTKSIYLGHHIKADDWLPPGGHVEQNEHPQHTVIREFQEELGEKIVEKQITLFDVSIKPINKPNVGCLTHFDIWYLVDVPDKTTYKFEEREFYDASWFSISEGANKITKNPDYKNIILKLLSADFQKTRVLS